jgi:hypothetical protein
MSKSKYPPMPDNRNKRGKNVFPDGKVVHFTITDEIRKPQSDAPNKIIYLQRVEFEDGTVELRLCYYIIGKSLKMEGKWVFGQFATFLPAKDFKTITEQARKRGWI